MSDISIAPISAAPVTYASSASPRTSGSNGAGGFRSVLKDTIGGVANEPEPPADQTESDSVTALAVGASLCMFLPSVVASQSQPSESTGTDAASGDAAGSAGSAAGAVAAMPASETPILTATATAADAAATSAKGAMAEGSGTKRTPMSEGFATQESTATRSHEAAPAGLHLKPERAATTAPTQEQELPATAGVAPEKDPLNPTTRRMMESLNATLATRAPAVEPPRTGVFDRRPVAPSAAPTDTTVSAAALASRQEAAGSAQSMPHLRAAPAPPARSGDASKENTRDDLRAAAAPASSSFTATAREAVRSGSGTLSQPATATERPRTGRGSAPYELTTYRVTQDQSFADKALAQTETSMSVERPAQPAPTGPVATFATQAETTVTAARAVDQVAEGLALNLRAGKTEATISLRPAALGDVKVQILSGSDGLIVRISAERDAVGDLLRARVGELREALAGRQLAVTELHVLHNPPAVQNTFTEQQRSTWQEQRRAHQQDDAPAEQGSEQRGQQPDEDE